MCLDRELALVQRRHTACVMGNDDVRVCLFLHDLDLALRGKGTAEVALHKDVPEPEPAAIEERRVVADRRTKRFERCQ